MKLSKTMELMKEYATCPECGNENVGNGEGALIVEEHEFIRSCKCGWNKTIREGE